MVIKAVFFDAGDTLLSPHPSFHEIFATVAADFGHELEPAKVSEIFDAIAPTFAEVIDSTGENNWSVSQEASRKFWGKLYGLVFDGLGIKDEAGELAAAMYQRFTRYESYRLFDDSIPVLSALREAGLTLGLISNFEEWLEGMLIEMEIAHLFDVMVVSGKEGVEKPHPDIFLMALSRTGQLAQESMYVGDSPKNDAEGARAVGMKGVLIDRSGRYPDYPGPKISSLHDLLPMILH